MLKIIFFGNISQISSYVNGSYKCFSRVKLVFIQIIVFEIISPITYITNVNDSWSSFSRVMHITNNAVFGMTFHVVQYFH